MSNVEFTYQFNTFSQYLRGFAYKLTRDTHSAEDLFQETALRAFDNKEQFRQSTNMKAWLSTIMKNTFINNFRRKQRWEKIIIQTDESYLIESDRKAAWNEGERKVSSEAIEQLIESLDPSLKTPFIMILKGYKYQEIADEMGIPIGTVKSRVFVARQVLKDKLKYLYHDPFSPGKAA